MAHIAGIQYEQDAYGNNTFVRIDLSRFGDIINPVLLQIKEKEADGFEEQWSKALTSQQAIHKTIKLIKEKHATACNHSV